jgi:hypothetical protein
MFNVGMLDGECSEIIRSSPTPTIQHLPCTIPNSAPRGTRATLRGAHRENFHPQEVDPLAALPQWYVPDRQLTL